MLKTGKNLEKLTFIPYWVFLLLFLASASVSVSALRNNNQTMVSLRNTLYTVDKNNGNVNAALNNLRDYVYAHMNTDLSSGTTIRPPIQLKYTYERLQAAEQARVSAANSQIYTDAENYCQIQDPTDFSGRNRVPCVTAYVTSHNVSANAIPVALYQFDFVSPTWSPDLAGWSLVVSAVLLLMTAASFGVDRLVRRKIRPL